MPVEKSTIALGLCSRIPRSSIFVASAKPVVRYRFFWVFPPIPPTGSCLHPVVDENEYTSGQNYNDYDDPKEHKQ